VVGPTADELFEQAYRAKFEELLARHGLTVKYELDRAALDIGFHPASPPNHGVTRPLGSTRIWFQLKGKQASTLTQEELERTTEVACSGIPKEQVQFWYAASEPVYLVVYLEAADLFIGEDVRDIVDRQWGEEVLRDGFMEGQNTVTLHVRIGAKFDTERVAGLIQHRSMRIDGPAFRGRPLGHRLDPLRCEARPLSPDNYSALVHRLLEVHGFEEQNRLNASVLGLDAADIAEFFVGRLFSTYEFVEPMFGEFGTSDPGGFRLEAPLESAHGSVAVLIHSSVQHHPQPMPAELQADLEARGCTRLLIFANTGSDNAAYFGAARNTSHLPCMPQRLGSLAFNILTATNVYLEFRHRLEWKLKNYLWA
jgi:hypothetical protein